MVKLLQNMNQEEFQKHIAELRARLDAAVKDASTGIITTEFVSKYIDKIFVSIIDADTAKLDIKIFTGKTTEKWFKKLNARAKGRTGQMSLTIWPPTEPASFAVMLPL